MYILKIKITSAVVTLFNCAVWSELIETISGSSNPNLRDLFKIPTESLNVLAREFEPYTIRYGTRNDYIGLEGSLLTNIASKLQIKLNFVELPTKLHAYIKLNNTNLIERWVIL